jgi:hypothetical protein
VTGATGHLAAKIGLERPPQEHPMTVWFGYHMPNFTFPGVPEGGLFDHVATLAGAAEEAGFSLVTVMDHFYQIAGVGPKTDPMLEAYATRRVGAAITLAMPLGWVHSRRPHRKRRNVRWGTRERWPRSSRRS